MAYATLNELKTYLNVQSSADDTLLTALLERATAVIERYACRRFAASADETRSLTASQVDTASGLLFLYEDLVAVTEVRDGYGTEIASSDYALMPPRGPHYAIQRLSGSWWPNRSGVVAQITGRWAYSVTPPPDIVHVCLRLAGYFYRQKDAQVFDVTAFPDAGQITIPRGIPADVKVILEFYRRLS